MGTRLFQRLLMPTFLNTFRPCPQTVLREKVVFFDPPKYSIIRCYAKSKDKGKDKKAKGVKIEINPVLMSELIPIDKMKERCMVSIDKLKEDFARNLSLRSTTGSLESLPVKFEGKEYELQELAQIVRKNPKTIVINFASFPQAIPDALKSIQSSGLNLNPQQDGTTLYVPVPKVTKEHREALAKNAKALYIKCRDALKDVQNDYIKKAKKQTGVSEDLVFSVTKQITAFCDNYQNEAKNIYENKHNELVGNCSGWDKYPKLAMLLDKKPTVSEFYSKYPKNRQKM